KAHLAGTRRTSARPKAHTGKQPSQPTEQKKTARWAILRHARTLSKRSSNCQDRLTPRIAVVTECSRGPTWRPSWRRPESGPWRDPPRSDENALRPRSGRLPQALPAPAGTGPRVHRG